MGNQDNLFYLSRSVLANAGFPDKFLLFPTGASDVNEVCCLYQSHGHPGNTMLGARPMQGTCSEARRTEQTVATLTLDQVFFSDTSPPYIHLLKIDAQGYEFKILRGAAGLMASGALNAVYFEFAREWLRTQGHEPIELFSWLHLHGYDIYKDVYYEEPVVPLTRLEMMKKGCPAGHYAAD